MSKELAVITQVKDYTTAVKAKTDLISAGHNSIVTSLVGYAVSTNAVPTYVNPIGASTVTGNSVIASGALTADTYKSVLSITGSGIFKTLGIAVIDSTARTISCKIIVDGTTIFEGSTATSATNGGIIPMSAMMGYNMVFDTSFEIQIKSTITETDKLNTHVCYYLT